MRPTLLIPGILLLLSAHVNQLSGRLLAAAPTTAPKQLSLTTGSIQAYHHLVVSSPTS
jgi:hypothetical protein